VFKPSSKINSGLALCLAVALWAGDAAGAFQGVRTGKTLYEMMGVPPTATHDEIFQTFKSAWTEFHPNDPSGNPTAYRTVEGVWSILGRPGLRKLYDEYLADLAKAKTPPNTDGEYQLGLFLAYQRVLMNEVGDADPAGYAHHDAFAIFRSMRETQLTPSPQANGLEWIETTATGTCRLWLGRLGRTHAVVGVLGSVAAATAVGWHLLKPKPPAVGTPSVAPATSEKTPLNAPADPDPAAAAAERRGEQAAGLLRDDGASPAAR
jgi:curved DNA-binding protein CbpA